MKTLAEILAAISVAYPSANLEVRDGGQTVRVLPPPSAAAPAPNEPSPLFPEVQQ